MNWKDPKLMGIIAIGLLIMAGVSFYFSKDQVRDVSDWHIVQGVVIDAFFEDRGLTVNYRYTHEGVERVGFTHSKNLFTNRLPFAGKAPQAQFKPGDIIEVRVNPEDPAKSFTSTGLSRDLRPFALPVLLLVLGMGFGTAALRAIFS